MATPAPPTKKKGKVPIDHALLMEYVLRSTSLASEQEVQAYLDTHKIQTIVEDAINACVKANAEDPCAHMSETLASKASPEKITKCVARQIFDSRGNPTVEVDVHTT